MPNKAAYDRQRRQDPEYKAKAAAYMRQRWQDPEFRAKMAGRRRNPEFRAKRAAYDRRKKGYSGMSPETYHQLLIDQAGLCSICDKPMTTACADHDHNSGIHRGLLCIACNGALGYVEKPGWLHRALAYIEEHTT